MSLKVFSEFLTDIVDYVKYNNKKLILYSMLMYSGYYIYKNYLDVKLKFAYELYLHNSTFNFKHVIKTHVSSLYSEFFTNLNKSLLSEINENLIKRYNIGSLFMEIQSFKKMKLAIKQIEKINPKTQERNPEDEQNEITQKESNDGEFTEANVKNGHNNIVEGNIKNGVYRDEDKEEINKERVMSILEMNQINLLNKSITSQCDKLKTISFLSLISGIAVSRILILISQTNLLILENLNRENSNTLGSEFIHNILTELWMLAKIDFIPYLLMFIEQRVSATLSRLDIKDKLSYEGLSSFMLELKNELFLFNVSANENIQLHIMKYYIDTIEKKVKSFEKENYNLIEDEYTRKSTDFYLQYFSNIYDILDSNIFNIILIKLIDEDFIRLNQMIAHFYNQTILNNSNTTNSINSNNSIKEEISVLKIVKNITLLNPRILNKTNSFFFNIEKMSEGMQRELEEYFKVLYI